MILFQRRNIRSKLTLALGGAALLAFAVAGIALGLYESLTLERRARQIMEPYAQLVSVGAETAVAFENPERAKEILTTFRANPQIREAEIVLRDGRLLAAYSSRANTTLRPHPFKADGFYLYDNNAELIQSLQDGAHLRLVMSLDELNRQTRNVLQLFGAGVLVLLAAVTLGLRATLQRTIVRPISTLAETVEQVRSQADYHQRVPESGDDEVARLGRSFNAMMGVIQAREDDLRRLTLFQRTILDNAAYGIISAAPDGIVSSFNPAAERLLGYAADEVVGKLTPACWHDPEEMARHALQLSEELGETVSPGFDVFAARPRRNLPEENEWTFIRKDGTRVPVLLSVTALRDESSQITGFVGLTYDLSERKRAEEERRESEAKYRRIVDTANEGIWSLGPDTMTTFVNTMMAEMLGYSREEMIGRLASDFMFEEDVPDHMRRMENRRQGLSENYERRLRRKDGEAVWTLASATPIFDDAHNFQGTFGMVTDITERKRAEEDLFRLNTELEERVEARTNDLEAKRIELVESQKALINIVEDLNQKTAELEDANAGLQELERLKSMFIASMSHELRTPLNSIIGFSSILLNEWLGPVNPEQKENLATILRSGKHLLNLINDVIDVSKIEAGKIECRLEEFDLYDLMSEAVQYVEKDIREKGLDLRLRLQHQTVCTERRRLLQCTINLLSNALKFTEQGGITVETSREIDATMGPSRLEGMLVSIAVHDTGIGIAAEDIPRLFQPFVRLDSPIKTTVPGTGLGLYLTRKLVEEVLRGNILCLSMVGVGSTFTIRIPERIDEEGTG